MSTSSKLTAGNQRFDSKPCLQQTNGIDWNEVGIRVAFGGGSFPLLLAAVLLVSALGMLCLGIGGSALTPIAECRLLEVFIMFACGSPFLVFICYLFSTLVSIPLLSVFAWVLKHADVRATAGWVTAVGTALVAVVWTSLFYWLACCSHLIS